MLLNGCRLRIKGFCRHEDHPQFGCALLLTPPSRRWIEPCARPWSKSLKCTSHYPNDEIFLDLCDEMGFLVWEETTRAA